MVYASLWAGSLTFGSFNSAWTPNTIYRTSIQILLLGIRFRVPTCLMVIAGFHDFSSSRMDRQTVPDGYTFG